MSKRILVVEDQPDNRQIIRDMLAGTDYEITEAENGEQALAASERAPRSHPNGYPTADHGRLRGHAPNQGRSGVAIDPDHRRYLLCAEWRRTDSAGGRM
jgi:CheY-like chemotaxis protein